MIPSSKATDPPRRGARRLGHLGVLLGLLALLVVIAQASDLRVRDLQRARSFHMRGARALERGDFGRAERDFRKALEIVPSFPESLAGLGHIAMREAHFEEALERYLAAEQSFVGLSAELAEFRTLRWMNAQDTIRKLQDYLADLKERESRIEMSLSSAAAAPAGLRREILEVERQIRELERIPEPGAERMLEVPPEIQFFIGNAFFHLGRAEDAVGRWRRCAEAQPDFGPVFNNLAAAYMGLGRHEEARRAAARAEELGIVLNPNLKRDLESLPKGDRP